MKVKTMVEEGFRYGFVIARSPTTSGEDNTQKKAEVECPFEKTTLIL